MVTKDTKVSASKMNTVAKGQAQPLRRRSSREHLEDLDNQIRQIVVVYEYECFRTFRSDGHEVSVLNTRK